MKLQWPLCVAYLLFNLLTIESGHAQCTLWCENTGNAVIVGQDSTCYGGMYSILISGNYTYNSLGDANGIIKMGPIGNLTITFYTKCKRKSINANGDCIEEDYLDQHDVTLSLVKTGHCNLILEAYQSHSSSPGGADGEITVTGSTNSCSNTFEVYLDGKVQGSCRSSNNFKIKGLATGAYNIEIRVRGCTTQSKKVTVSEE